MLCFVFAALVVLLDQFFKRWILLTLALGEDLPLIPGVIGLTNVENTGAAFSILSDQRWLLIGIVSIAVVLLIVILIRYNEGFWGTLGIAAVLGGALGNLIDRIFLGYAVDMFELYFMNFAIFNVADIFITLGGITFIIYFIAVTLKRGKPEDAAYDASGAGQARQIENSRPQFDDEPIGRYTFDFDEKTPYSGFEDDIFGSAPDTAPQDTGSAPSGDYSAYTAQADDYSTYAAAPPDDYGSYSASDVFSEYESGLPDADAVEEYDIDSILREFGFDDDSDKM